MSSPIDEPAMAGHIRSFSSPSLSSSSHTPSSCNLDDVGPHDLSDVSSLDGSEFEIIDVVRRPASSLSARSREHAGAEGSHDAPYDGSLLGDHADQWATVPRHTTLADGSHAVDVHRLAPNQNSRTQRVVGGDNIDGDERGDLSAVLNEQDAAEADLLNRSLTSTFALSRHEQQDSGPSSSTNSTCIVTPLASILANATSHRLSSFPERESDGENAIASSDATPSVLAASQFTFPDPLSVSMAGPVGHEDEGGADAAGGCPVVSAPSDHSQALRNRRWTPVPSEAKTTDPSMVSRPSERGWNRARAAAAKAGAPTATASSFGFNTFDPASLGSTEVAAKSGDLRSALAGRPVRRTHIDLPAAINVYYLGRRPSAAVLWRISQAVKSSLVEAAGVPLQPHARDVHQGGIVVTRSAAGNAFGKRVLHLKEVDCTEARDDSAERTAMVEGYLKGTAAHDVAKGNALIICCLEGGEASTSTSLPSHLASLLELIHARLPSPTQLGSQAAQVPKPLVLPVSCPRSSADADDAISIASSGQRELVRQLSSRMDVQAIDREWSSTLAETLRLLKAICSAPHLHVQFAPGTAFVRVIGFEALVSNSASWFRGDATWACRAAMTLTTPSNSPLVLLQGAESEPRGMQAPPAWLTKTRKWLSRGAQNAPFYQESLESGKEKLEDDEVLGPLEDRDDLERLSTRKLLSRHRMLKLLVLAMSLLSCAALLGNGTVPLANKLFDQGTRLSRASLSKPTAMSIVNSLTPGGGGAFLDCTRNLSQSIASRHSASSSLVNVPAAGSSGTSGTSPTASRRTKSTPSKPSELRPNAMASTAVAVRSAANQTTGLSVYQQTVFGDPPMAVTNDSGSSRTKGKAKAKGRAKTKGKSKGVGRVQRSAGGSATESAASAPAQGRVLDRLLRGAHQAKTALIAGARLSWQYWLSELWRVYHDIVLPAQQYYADASLHASRMLHSARTASKVFADKHRHDARHLLSDAVRGAVVVDDMVRARALETRQWARSIFRDMTKGAVIVSDAASSSLASAAEELKTKGENLAQHLKSKRLDERLRQRASEARRYSDQLLGSALRRGDEQLEYWFFADDD
ncbi:uncharacterized protein PFL1_06341 [Pseudozyma flocculosa PF-1]|uniref:Uncharacterized protein n=2 Tax=Pseudozyma flocculosa TaxID=84751 RepID=A0A5C3F832_9BASI|nr:uncharacterized protein PFL1_06341 [Pseudozyma flocculosa PF-1]EPQ26133.1 hypothetical protein PFL1_06341 [Pseudozyma flocculosa PF-1]SPO40380.1 uncharacterized protein PSFLO_05862 [Pseudozyma flocculosa]